jgi:hypothetical protein
MIGRVAFTCKGTTTAAAAIFSLYFSKYSFFAVSLLLLEEQSLLGSDVVNLKVALRKINISQSLKWKNLAAN